MRLEKVLDAAKVKGLRTGDNPAQWKGHLDLILPRHPKAARGHHAAMPFTEVPAFMAELTAMSSMAAKAFRFLILTAARTAEVLGARWPEIDIKARVWTVPGVRMKSRRSHRVPLPALALGVLAEATGGHDEWVFPSPNGGALSNMALLMLLRRTRHTDATARGFRSSFRDWAAETTAYPREVAEMALAHAIESDTEAAYRRGDLFEKRRLLMDAWGQYLAGDGMAPGDSGKAAGRISGAQGS
jgi:integrase